MSASRSPLRPLDRMLFVEYADLARGLPAVRILLALLLLVAWTPNSEWVGNLPDSFLAPRPGPFLLLHGIPSETVIGALEIARVIAAGALLVGWRTAAASVATSLLAIALLGLQYSFGKINHSILIVLAPLLLAPSGWGHRWSVDALRGRRPRVRAWSPALFALAMGAAYATAGLAKVLGGWLRPSTQAAQKYVLRKVLARDDILLGDLVQSTDIRWVWELADIATVVVEVGLVVLALRLAWYRLGLVALIGLHLSVFLTMGIDFGPTTYVYAVFLPWHRLVDRVDTRVGAWSHESRRRALQVGAGLAAAALAIGVWSAVTNKPPWLTLVRTVAPDAAEVATMWQLAVATLVTVVAVARIVVRRVGGSGGSEPAGAPQ